MKQWIVSFILCSMLTLPAVSLHAQAPEGPMAPKPDVPIQQPPAPSTPQVKVRVSLVSTPVTVRNSKGAMIHDLDVADFRVTDNGVPQRILRLDIGSDPISLVILLENSVRIAPLLPAIRKTGILFTQTVMGPLGEGAVVTFSDSIDKLLDFTARGDLIESTISHIDSGTSGNKLYDAMNVGVEMLSGRPQPPPDTLGGRRVLMIISESTDIGSGTKLGEVLRRAQLANVTIYSVGLSTTRAELQEKPKKGGIEPATPPGIMGQPPFPGSVQTPTTEEQRDDGINLMAIAVAIVQHADNAAQNHALEVATLATGGAHLSTFKDRSIEKAIDEIGGELHEQYNISYAPVGTSEFGYHEIKVNVEKKGLKARSRPGYFVAAPGS
jgi:VWFA-related protein